MNSFASSDQKDFDQLAAAGNRISHGINNVHNDLNQTNSLIKSGFSQQGGILSTIRSGISNVGQGIAKAYNRNKEDYGVNTQEFSRRVAAMAGGPIGLAVRDVISNSGISIGNVVKKSVGGIANMFHGHRNSETQILDNDLNKLNTLNNRQLRATNEQTEAIRDGNKILGELRNIARGEGSVSNVPGRNGTPNVTQRANAASRNAVAGGSSSTSSPVSSVGVGSGSSEVINLLREIADNQKNLKNVFTDPEGKEEPGIFKSLAKDLISMPFGFKYWFSGRYAKDIKRSNNPLETIVNALIKMYEWERIGIDLSRRQLNQLIKAAGGQEQKYVGHEGTMITAVKRASGAIKQGAVKTFGNNAFGRMVGGALSLPLAFLRFGEQDFEDQQYLKAYQVATGLGKSKKKGLSGFFDNITGGDKDLNRILYSERNVRKTIDELLGGDFDNSELNRRTFLHKRSFDKADDKKIQRILRDPELLKALQVLNDYRHDPSADDENIKLDVKDLRRLIAKKIGDYGLDGIHGSRVEANSLLKGIKSKESLLSAKDSDFTIKDLFGEISTSISRKAEDREYIKELEKILNDPDSERSTKLSAAQELERIEAELNKRVLATGGVINRKADIISERTGKKVAEISEKNQKESVIPFDDTPEGVKTLQDLGATISRYISNPNNEKIGKQGEPLLTNNITPVVPIGLTPRIVAKLIKEHPGMITRKNFPKKIDGSSSNSADGFGIGSIFGKVDKGEALDGGKNNEELLIDSETKQTNLLEKIYGALDGKDIKKKAEAKKKESSSSILDMIGGAFGGLVKGVGSLIGGIASLTAKALGLAAKFGLAIASVGALIYGLKVGTDAVKGLADKIANWWNDVFGAGGEGVGNKVAPPVIYNIAKHLNDTARLLKEHAERGKAKGIPATETEVKAAQEHFEKTKQELDAYRKEVHEIEKADAAAREKDALARKAEAEARQREAIARENEARARSNEAEARAADIKSRSEADINARIQKASEEFRANAQAEIQKAKEAAQAQIDKVKNDAALSSAEKDAKIKRILDEQKAAIDKAEADKKKGIADAEAKARKEIADAKKNAQAEVDRLKKELEQAQADAKKAARDAASAERQKSQAEIDRINGELEASKTKIKELQSNLDEAHKAAKKATKDAQAAQNAAVKKASAEAQQQAALAEQKRVAAELKVQELQQQLDALKNRQNALKDAKKGKGPVPPEPEPVKPPAAPPEPVKPPAAKPEPAPVVPEKKPPAAPPSKTVSQSVSDLPKTRSASPVNVVEKAAEGVVIPEEPASKVILPEIKPTNPTATKGILERVKEKSEEETGGAAVAQTRRLIKATTPEDYMMEVLNSDFGSSAIDIEDKVFREIYEDKMFSAAQAEKAGNKDLAHQLRSEANESFNKWRESVKVRMDPEGKTSLPEPSEQPKPVLPKPPKEKFTPFEVRELDRLVEDFGTTTNPESFLVTLGNKFTNDPKMKKEFYRRLAEKYLDKKWSKLFA